MTKRTEIPSKTMTTPSGHPTDYFVGAVRAVTNLGAVPTSVDTRSGCSFPGRESLSDEMEHGLLCSLQIEGGTRCF